MVLAPSLLDRIAQSLRTARSTLMPSDASPAGSIEARGEPRAASNDSILARAAELYGSKRGSEDTPPTGFDPAAAALFEALVEGAFLVANADGEFDAEERAAFAHVVLTATDGRISGDQLTALLEDLKRQLAADGHDQRVAAVGKTVSRPEAQREVLRVAALVAHISGGISAVERATMDRLAAAFGVAPAVVEAVIGEARALLDG